MYVVGSFNNESFEELADVTDSTKIEYGNIHGYEVYLKKNNWRSSDMGFARIHYVKEAFELFPETEWLFLVDCDAIITNYTIKIEDMVDNNYHLIYTVYHNGFNVGNGLFRNSPEGRDYIDYILSLEGKYLPHPWKEQQAIIDTYERYKNIIKVVPARFMNSLQRQVYDRNQLPTEIDLLGHNMLWQPGDWALHWPGADHKGRIEQAKVMLNNIVR